MFDVKQIKAGARTTQGGKRTWETSLWEIPEMGRRGTSPNGASLGDGAVLAAGRSCAWAALRRWPSKRNYHIYNIATKETSQKNLFERQKW